MCNSLVWQLSWDRLVVSPDTDLACLSVVLLPDLVFLLPFCLTILFWYMSACCATAQHGTIPEIA